MGCKDRGENGFRILIYFHPACVDLGDALLLSFEVSVAVKPALLSHCKALFTLNVCVCFKLQERVLWQQILVSALNVRI